MALTLEEAWRVLDGVADPEIPVLSLREMGILRDIRHGPEGLEVLITPTYSGCPAMAQIAEDVLSALAAHGQSATVRTQLAPAWTTDWISDSAREKLRAYGIAPPGPTGVSPCAPAGAGVQPLRFVPGAAAPTPAVACPRCGSEQTVQTAPFGSTACKALYRCLSCREPFDHFKPY